MKTEVRIDKIAGCKKEIRSYAYTIASLDGGSNNQYAMAFGMPDEDGEELILWCVQAGDGIETAKEVINWDGVQRVEIYDYGCDGDGKILARFEDVYVANRAALARYTADRKASEFVVDGNYTKYAVTGWAPEDDETPAPVPAILKKKVCATLALVALSCPDGYTVDAKTLQPITTGYSVAVKGTQDSFGDDGLRRVVEYQAAHPECTAFGGWLDKKTGLYYYDACLIVGTKAEAMALAKENKQIAFFCLHELQEYNQDGTIRVSENED